MKKKATISLVTLDEGVNKLDVFEKIPTPQNISLASSRRETLNHTMRISIEGPDKLNLEDLDSIIQYWKEKKLENQ